MQIKIYYYYYYIKLLIFVYKTNLYLAFQVAFSVARTTNWTLSGELFVKFDIFTADVLSGFVLSDGNFIVPKSGIYISHVSGTSYSDDYMAINIDSNGQCQHALNVGGNGLIRKPETCGIYTMMNLEANSQNHYNTKYRLYSDRDGLQTSWSTFRLDDIMQPLVAFSVASVDASYAAPRVLPFNIVHVNQGFSWNCSANEFVVTVDGIYFMSLNSFSYMSASHRIEIQINQNPLAMITVDNAQQFGDTFSNSFLVPLSTNDVVRAYLRSGIITSSSCYNVSFIGFLYEPIHAMKVAWSVHRTTSAVGPLEPVSFDYVMVNVGYGWNVANNSFTAPVSGVYYLHINDGKVIRKKVNFQVIWNDKPYINLFTEYTHHDGTETRGRAIMTNLTQGDRLHLKLWSGTEVYSDIYKQTSFSGFLLYPSYY